MGYTHYWSQTPDITPEIWKLITYDVKLVLKKHEIAPLVCFEFDEPDKAPMITDEVIRFNGKGEDGHETFCLHRSQRGGRAGLCKTAAKPYDLAVTACLCIIGHHLTKADIPPGITSDGYWSEWKGRGIAMDLLAVRSETLHFTLEDG